MGSSSIANTTGNTTIADKKAHECRIFDYRVLGDAESRKLRRTWLTFDTIGYVSTGKNSDSLDFHDFDSYMVAIEPMVEMRSFTNAGKNALGDKVKGTGNLSFHHGLVGLSYDVLFGKEFSAFDNVGIKFRPVGVTYKNFNAAFNLRWYPDRFTAAQFGMVDPTPSDPESSEWLWGFSAGWIWGPK